MKIQYRKGGIAAALDIVPLSFITGACLYPQMAADVLFV
jgi:hypothetical protein